ncbi:MAG TPA: hypothetical protein VGA80_00055 [Flavobacteriaceae bacterium]|jgi:hypothetical protein
MYKYLFIIFIIVFNSLQSQTQNSTNTNIIGQGDLSNGFWVLSNPTLKQIEGSPYLFDSWYQTGKLFFGDKVYSINALNYNISAERFEAKISEDSVFALNHGGFNKVLINGKSFSRHLDPDFQRNTYFENVIQFKDMLLLKKYVLKIVEGQINPMTRKKIQPDRFIKNEKFYVLVGEPVNMEEVKLKKSSILQLINDNEISKVKNFAKKNKLGFNNIDDVYKILNYYNSL